MDWYYYLVLFVAVMGTFIATQLFQAQIKKSFDVILTTSGAFLFGILFLHLIPETILESNSIEIGKYILIGFIIQVCLDFMSKGVEHGHIHAQPRIRNVVIVLLGLSIHAFLEGIPLAFYQEGAAHAGHDHSHHGHGHHHHAHSANHLFYGILLHKIPAAFALASLLKVSNIKTSTAVIFMFIFAAMTPLGALSASAINVEAIADMNLIYGIVIGSLLHICTTILFEIDKSGHHNISWKKIMSLAIGFGIAFLTGH